MGSLGAIMIEMCDKSMNINKQVIELNKRKLIKYALKAVFIVSIGVLLIESATLFQSQNYWRLFVNAIFVFIACYMLFWYESRKLQLNQDLIKILLVFFIGLFVRSLVLNQILDIVIASVMIVGFVAYLGTSLQNRHRLYINKHQIRRKIQ